VNTNSGECFMKDTKAVYRFVNLIIKIRSQRQEINVKIVL
jgi:hypothetical protein